MPQVIEAPLRALERGFMLVAQLAIVVMMLTISIDATGRYVFNKPLTGGYDLVTFYFMIMLGFLAMPDTYARNGHIRLDVMASRLSHVPGQIPERINALLAAVVFAFITWYAGHDAVEKFVHLETSFGAIQFPMYWSYVWVPIGAALLTVRLALEVVFPKPLVNGDAS